MSEEKSENQTATTSHYPAFDEATAEQNHRHTLTMVVRDRAGTIAKVVGLFSARSYNIDSISASNIDHDRELSSITIITYGTDRVVRQIISQLERLINVFYVTNVTESKDRVLREMALIKMRATGEKRLEALTIANSFHANIVDAAEDAFIVEIMGAPQKLNSFIDLLRPLGVIDVVKSGPAGMVNTPDALLENISSEDD